MSLAGIIAEFNPLHNGHKYIIDRAKSDGYDVAIALSGNFVQRGDTAIVPKFCRAKTALYAGAQIVVEVPVPWSMSTAQNFALGGVSQLLAMGIDALYFGSECGNTALLEEIADIVISDKFSSLLELKLKSGETFAKLRQNTVSDILGEDAAMVLENPNDALAVEYIIASKKLKSSIKFCAVERVGTGHNDLYTAGNYCSSTFIREKIKSNKLDGLSKLVPPDTKIILSESPISDIKRIDTAIISRIKQLSVNELSLVQDVSEGLENLIFEKAKECFTFDELCNSIKSKRYTFARIRRILLAAYLGIDNCFFGKEPPYVRILAADSNGIKKIPKSSTKPIVTRVSQIDRSNSFVNKVFETEMIVNELYALSLDNPKLFVSEFKEKFIIK